MLNRPQSQGQISKLKDFGQIIKITRTRKIFLKVLLNYLMHDPGPYGKGLQYYFKTIYKTFLESKNLLLYELKYIDMG